MENTIRRLFLLLFAAPMMVAFLAVPGHATTSRSTAISRTATPSDAEIQAKIQTKLAKSKIGKDGFRFHVQHGVVTWEGTTNVMQHKGSATRMARTAGAVQVVNNIHVSASAKAAATANLKKAQVSD